MQVNLCCVLGLKWIEIWFLLFVLRLNSCTLFGTFCALEKGW